MTTERAKRPPTASAASNTNKPGAAVAAPPPGSASSQDLETRIRIRKQDMISELVELRGRTTQGAADLRDKLKARLSELGHLVKEGVVDGWSNIDKATRSKLDHWLTK